MLSWSLLLFGAQWCGHFARPNHPHFFLLSRSDATREEIIVAMSIWRNPGVIDIVDLSSDSKSNPGKDILLSEDLTSRYSEFFERWFDQSSTESGIDSNHSVRYPDSDMATKFVNSTSDSDWLTAFILVQIAKVTCVATTKSFSHQSVVNCPHILVETTWFVAILNTPQAKILCVLVPPKKVRCEAFASLTIFCFAFLIW